MAQLPALVELLESTRIQKIAHFRNLVQQLDFQPSTSDQLPELLTHIHLHSIVEIWDVRQITTLTVPPVKANLLLPLFIQLGGVEKLLNLFLDTSDSCCCGSSNLLFTTLKTIQLVFSFKDLHTHWSSSYTWALPKSNEFVLKLITLTSNRSDSQLFTMSQEILHTLWHNNFNFLFKYFARSLSTVTKHINQLLRTRLADNEKRTGQDDDLSEENQVMLLWCQTFVFLCRDCASVVRNDELKTLVLLIESSNPNGSKVCKNLSEIHYDALLTASMFKKMRCLTSFHNLGLIHQLTQKIVNYNRKRMNNGPRYCFGKMEDPALAKEFKLIADPSVVPTFPHWWDYQVIDNPEELKTETLLREMGHVNFPCSPLSPHVLSLRIIYKWALGNLMSALIQSDLIYALIDYLTQTPFPDPLACSILMLIARTPYETSAGIAGADNGCIPLYIAKQFNTAAGTFSSIRCKESCELHRALTKFGKDILSQVGAQIMERREVYKNDDDWTIRAASPILFPSLRDLTGIGGFNPKSLDLILANLRDDETHTEEALISLSSLAFNLGIEELLCPWTPTLEHVFVPCRCRITSIPEDARSRIVHFAIRTLPGISNPLNNMLKGKRHCQPVVNYVSETLKCSEISRKFHSVLQFSKPDKMVTRSGLHVYETTWINNEEIFSISTVGLHKELLAHSTPYFKLLFEKIASDQLTVGSSVGEAIVLPEMDFNIFGPVIHAIYGCGKGCPYIQTLCSLVKKKKTAKEVLGLLHFFGAEKIYQRVTDVVATQRVKPEHYVDLLMSLDVTFRRWMRHVILMPLLPSSGYDLPTRLALIQAVLKSQVIFERQGQVEIKLAQVYSNIWRYVLAIYLKFPATDAERRLCFITEPEFLLPAEGEPGHVVFSTRQLVPSSVLHPSD